MPLRVPVVVVTGVIELLVAVALLFPRLRTLAAWSMFFMLLGFLPINIHAAMNHVGMGGHQWGPVYLLIRIPLQLILLGWTWGFVIRPTASVPVTFSCTETLKSTPEEIGRQILNVANWPDFGGYAFLPGIEVAEFEVETPDVVGSRIRVKNTDGSRHVEEIFVWDLPRRLQLRMRDFTPPLSRLATGFVETWDFTHTGGMTNVVRSFELHPQNALTRPLLWLISVFLKKAVAHHLGQIRANEQTA